MSDWHPFEEGKTITKTGSEGGVIILDDEHEKGARITLERGCLRAPFAITCGVYGWMVHTRFLADDETAQHAVEEMKSALKTILCQMPDDQDSDVNFDELTEALADFAEQYP
ncbi:MAG: hypothetical protein K8L99_33665 [Anaerolineae bacterium]|nr:hypothetical protein [Anaerolineae bacterium]